LTHAAGGLAVVPGTFYLVDTGGNVFGLSGGALSPVTGTALGAPGGLAAGGANIFVAAAGAIFDVPTSCNAACTPTSTYSSLTSPAGPVLFGLNLAWTVGPETALDIGTTTAGALVTGTLPTGSTPLQGATAADSNAVYVAAANNVVLQLSAAGTVAGQWTAPATVVALASDGTVLLGLSHPATGVDMLWSVSESASKAPAILYSGFTAAPGGLALSSGTAYWTDAVANGTVESLAY
jgi:hypothetical protein